MPAIANPITLQGSLELQAPWAGLIKVHCSWRCLTHCRVRCLIILSRPSALDSLSAISPTPHSDFYNLAVFPAVSALVAASLLHCGQVPVNVTTLRSPSLNLGVMGGAGWPTRLPPLYPTALLTGSNTAMKPHYTKEYFTRNPGKNSTHAQTTDTRPFSFSQRVKEPGYEATDYPNGGREAGQAQAKDSAAQLTRERHARQRSWRNSGSLEALRVFFCRQCTNPLNYNLGHHRSHSIQSLSLFVTAKKRASKRLKPHFHRSLNCRIIF